MALIVNGVTIPSSGVVTYNGVSLDKVICNGVTVFQKEIREPASGEYYYNNMYTSWHWAFNANYKNILIYWNNTLVAGFNGTSSTASFTSTDGYTYYRGTYKQTITVNSATTYLYGIYRIKN